jgi:hypothetical protein
MPGVAMWCGVLRKESNAIMYNNETAQWIVPANMS